MRVEQEGKAAPKTVAKKRAVSPAVVPFGLGGYIGSDLNDFEASKLAPPVGGGKSINLERLAREIAADQKKSKQTTSMRKKGQKAAGNSLHWLIDQLSRPANALDTGIKNLGDKNPDTGFLGGVRSGWNLNERTNWAEIMEQPGFESPFYHPGKKTRAISGLTMDLMADPLNLVGSGIGVKTIQGGEKAFQTLRGAREAGNVLQDAVKSRVTHIPIEQTPRFVMSPERAQPFNLKTITTETPDEILQEGKTAAKKIKKGKKSKAETKIEQVLNQMEISPKIAQGADDPTGTLVTALREAGVKEGNLSRLIDKLPKTANVKIEPLRAAEHQGLLEEVAKIPSKQNVTQVVFRTPHGTDLHPDLVAKLQGETKRITDQIYDQRFGEKVGKVTQTKAGKNKFETELSGLSMADLRTLAAFETSDRAKELYKVRGVATAILRDGRKIHVSDPLGMGAHAIGSAKSVKTGTGIEINTSYTHLLRTIENSAEYRRLEREAANRAIAAHNRGIPKAQKNLPLIARSLEPLPKADEIVAAVAKKRPNPTVAEGATSASDARAAASAVPDSNAYQEVNLIEGSARERIINQAMAEGRFTTGSHGRKFAQLTDEEIAAIKAEEEAATAGGFETLADYVKSKSEPVAVIGEDGITNFATMSLDDLVEHMQDARAVGHPDLAKIEAEYTRRTTGGKRVGDLDELRLTTAKSEIARRSAVAGGGETKNLQAVVDKLEPIAPQPAAVKAAETAQGTYVLTPELERIVDEKIESTLNAMATGKVGSQKGHTFFSAIKQANLYEKIKSGLIDGMGFKKGLSRTIVTNDPVFRQFIREQYLRAEQIMELQHGYTPLEYARGTIGTAGLRSQKLSDFFAHVPVEDEMAYSGNNYWTKIMTGEDGSGLAERLFAGTAIVEAPKVAHIVEETADTAITAVDTLPEQQAMDILDATPKAGKETAKKSGLSPSAQEVTKDNLESAVDGIAKSKGELWALRYDQRTIRSNVTDGSARLGLREAEATDRMLGIGNIGNHSLIKINASAIKRNAGKLSPGMVNALDNASTKARAAGERLTVRFNAGHGYDPFFHTMRRGIANSAGARSQQHMSEISRTFTGMNSDDLKNLLNDVQMGKLDSLQAKAAHDMLNNIFDPKDGWLTQNGISFQEFQEQLHRLYPTRVNSSGKAFTDWRPQVMEKPVDKLKNAKPDVTWHDSWKYWTWTDSPAADLLKVRLAFENAYHQRLMYEDLAHNFAISSKDLAGKQARAEGWVELPNKMHPALKDQLFPPEIAEQITKHEASFKMRKDVTSDFMKNYDKMLQAWKTGVTIYSPAHHIRNMVGDMWMAYFVDGVKNPIHYKQAMRAVLHERPDLNPAAFGEALTKTADKDVLFKLKNGTQVTAEQFRLAWRDMGGHQAFASADNLADLTSVKGKIPTFVRDKIASPIEDVTRMGHAIALLKRGNYKDLVSAMEEVVPRVNRAHVDYGNLTDTERNVMRRLIPFYTWQRHVFPVLLDSMLRNPSRIMAYPKIQVNIAEARGYERDDSNFFPQGHTLAPAWMTEGAGVPYAQNKRGNTVYGDPSNPFMDAIFKNFLLHPKQSIGGTLSPAVRVPIEMFIKNDPLLAPEGRQFFGNIPIKNRAEYVEDNIPLLNQFIRMTRMDPIHKFGQRAPTEDRPDEQGLNMSAVINFLTAGGTAENTERRQEFATKMEGARNG